MAVAVSRLCLLTDSDSGSVDWLSRWPIAVSIRSFLRRNGWSKAAKPDENICKTDIFISKML